MHSARNTLDHAHMLIQIPVLMHIQKKVHVHMEMEMDMNMHVTINIQINPHPHIHMQILQILNN